MIKQHIMDKTREVEHKIYESSNDILLRADLKYLKFSKRKKEYIVALVDDGGYEIIRGYGETAIEALNDMHNNLI